MATGWLAVLNYNRVADTLPSRPQPNSPFFKLPVEIREHIYKYVLTRDQAFLWPAENMLYNLSPAFLLTCRDIYAEAAPIMYRINRFSFKHPSDCNVFCKIMSAIHIPLILKVGFHIRDKDSKLFLDYFSSYDPVRSLNADLPDLQYLIIFLTQNWPPNSNPDDLIKNWTQGSTLRAICEKLAGRTRAEVTVLLTIRISEQLFEHLIMTHQETLSLMEVAKMRSRPAEVYGARVMLELFAPGLSPDANPP